MPPWACCTIPLCSQRELFEKGTNIFWIPRRCCSFELEEVYQVALNMWRILYCRVYTCIVSEQWAPANAFCMLQMTSVVPAVESGFWNVAQLLLFVPSIPLCDVDVGWVFCYKLLLEKWMQYEQCEHSNIQIVVRVNCTHTCEGFYRFVLKEKHLPSSKVRQKVYF